MRRVVIVGLKGLGMAYACAAGRLNYPVAAMVDIDHNVLRMISESPCWINRFDNVEESVPAQDKTVFLTPDRLDRVSEPDVVILTVPPHVMEDTVGMVCTMWRKCLILCEKPLWLGRSMKKFVGGRLRLSGEYALLDGLGPCLAGCTKIRIFSTRPTMTTQWGYRLSMLSDYGPHLGSLFYEHLGDRSAGWLQLDQDLDWFRGKLKFGENTWLVEAVRSPHVPYSWEFDDVQYHWQTNLFDLQLASNRCGMDMPGIEIAEAISTGRMVSP